MSGCGAEQGLIGIDQAIDLILKYVQPLEDMQLPVQAAIKHYAAQAVHAQINLPSFSQSAVDGYALCSTRSNLEHVEFSLKGEIRAGAESHERLQENQAIRIFTGGKIPEGTTHVARQEIVEVLSSESIRLIEPLKPHADIRFVGEEVKQGDVLAEQGQYLNIGAIAALSMAGVQTVKVYRRPKVVVLVTGDEVAQTSQDFSAGKIFDANGPLLQAWLADYGLDVQIIHVNDQAEKVQAHFNYFKHSHDLIITTGGVSVGDYDFVRPCALDADFTQIFWKVKQKPGKPLFFAQYAPSDQSQPCYLLGLPGNPAAVYVSMQIYGRLLLNALQGHCAAPDWFTATLSDDLKPDQRERFLRMYAYFDQGQLKVKSLAKQQSHMLSNLMQANCLVRIPASIHPHENMVVSGVFIAH